MKYFFVTGLGRMGSKSLAHMLNCVPAALVNHEPCRDDGNYLPMAYYGGATRVVREYIRRRRAMLESRFPPGLQAYGEVNSLLRYFVDALAEEYDHPFVAFVVRNGRDYLRSVYVRNVYTDATTHAHVVPKDDDPWADHWPTFSRFEKLCWYWTHTNEHLLRTVPRYVRFEDIFESFPRFRTELLEPVGLTLTEDVYRREVARPQNTTSDFLRWTSRKSLWGLLGRPDPVPPDRVLGDWTPDREEAFQRICGQTMERFGYR